MLLAGLSARTWVVIGLIVGAAFLVGAIWSNGRDFQAAKEAREDTADIIAAGEANTKTANAVADAADRMSQIAPALLQEAHNARRQFESFDAAPAPGTVGPEARLDPAFSRLLLDCVARVRDLGAAAAGCDPAANPAD